jgi:ribonuclease VapC
MIFIDASAMTAIICREPEADVLARCLGGSGPFFTSPFAIYESALAVTRATQSSVEEATGDVHDLLSRAGAQIVPLTEDHASIALSAFARFGKGRHPAKLNMGDCFAYAAARARNSKILFVGDDLTQTDLESAIPAR